MRNSNAVIVAEAAGKYAFEYMTGGVGVILGPVGPVLGSGLTGGVLYVLDETPAFAGKVHPDVIQAPIEDADLAALCRLVTDFAAATRSPRARALLASWDGDDQAPRFHKLVGSGGA